MFKSSVVNVVPSLQHYVIAALVENVTAFASMACAHAVITPSQKHPWFN